MTFDKIKAIIMENMEINADKISMETAFEELGIDSLDMMQIIMQIEDEFEVEIDAEAGFKTVAELVEFLDK